MLDLVAKTQNSSVLDDRFNGFFVPSLQEFIDDDPDEMALCLSLLLSESGFHNL